MSSWKTILCIPDTHVPDHHRAAFDNITEFVAEFGPDEILQLGDFIDCPGPARWNKGMAEEFSGGLQEELDIAHKLLGNLREFHDGPFNYIEGNHEARIGNYLRLYAPAFAKLRSLRLADLLGLDELDIVLRPQPFRIARDFYAIHGDKLSSIAGGLSALKMVRETGVSTIQGHSHRLGIVYRTTDKERVGVEAGHISDQRKASYITYGRANWQMGFSILNVKGNRVHPEIVPIAADGSFQYQGVEFPIADEVAA